ncbi:MAG: hypothetical protein EKK45_05575 [Curvibacter sp.]|nr:MAG: hypothetical protein EKK45_05575 [Curvibacter sp.]
MNVAPTLPHFVWSLPPEGAQPAFGRPGGGLNVAPTLPHFVWSLPPKGAAGRLGAARRRPVHFVSGPLHTDLRMPNSHSRAAFRSLPPGGPSPPMDRRLDRRMPMA